MKVKFFVLGKTAFPDVKAGEDRYIGRLQHYCSFERVEIPDVKNPKALSQDQLKKKEGELRIKFSKERMDEVKEILALVNQAKETTGTTL